MKPVLKWVILFFYSLGVVAQETPKATWNVQAMGHYGVLLPEYGFISYLTEEYINGAEISVFKQSVGKTIWERLYHFPAFGASFFYSTLANDRVFGRQYSLYPHYTIHLIEREKFSFDYQLGCGVSFVTQKFDFDTNYENLVIGSHWNIFFNFKLQTKYRIHPHFFLNAGLAFNHISNANLSEPNVGLNYATFFSGFSYEPGILADRIREPVESFKPKYEYNIIACGGLKHTRTFESFSYPAVSLSFDLKRRSWYKFAVGVGGDIFYDSSIQPQMERLNKPYKSSYSYNTGIHLMQEFIYDKLSLIIQEGFYIGLREQLNGYVMYNRAIVRYQLGNHLFASISMKSHVFILDFPEIGIGFRK